MFRNLFALIGLAFVLFVVVGFTMKWYTFSREDGKLTIHIFTDKVEEGLKDIKNKAVDLGSNFSKALTKPEDTTPKQPEPVSFGGLFTPTPKAAQPTGLPPASLPMPTGGR
jgi:hypothetical protein